MARITQELALCLPGLIKAVFSQPTDANGAKKIELRPLLLKGERRYQAERFEGTKAFHENFTESALLAWAEEKLEGRFRQVLLADAPNVLIGAACRKEDLQRYLPLMERFRDYIIQNDDFIKLASREERTGTDFPDEVQI